MTKSGPLYREGGFFYWQGDLVKLYLLTQVCEIDINCLPNTKLMIKVYKDDAGYIYAVCEELLLVRRRTDLFLQEMLITLYQRSGIFTVLENLSNVSYKLKNIQILSFVADLGCLTTACLSRRKSNDLLSSKVSTQGQRRETGKDGLGLCTNFPIFFLYRK